MFRKLALFSVFLTLCLLILGAYDRAMEAGMGCPDWPGCLGQIIDVEAQRKPPTGNNSDLSVWLSLAHQGLAVGIVTLVLALSALAWRVPQRRGLTLVLSCTALVLVALQGVAGLKIEELPETPLMDLAHVLAGLLSLGVFYSLSLTQVPAAGTRSPVGGGLRLLAHLGLLALLVEAGLGVWTGVNDAGLACQDFPTCMGSFNPPVDYAEALSAAQDGGTLSLSARAAIQCLHRYGALLVFLLLTALALGLTSNRKAPHLSKPALLLNGLLLVQIVLGLASVMLRLPIALVVAHSAVSALLLLNLLHIVWHLRPAVAEAPASELRVEVPTPIELPQLPRETLPPAKLPPEPVAVEREVLEVATPPVHDGLFGRLKTGLGKTRGGLTGFLANLALGRKSIDGDLLEDIEAQLLMADIGVAATADIIRELTDSLERSQLGDLDALTRRLREQLFTIIEPVSRPLHIPPEKRPFVILVVGVNGVGKTTTIGKLANRLKNQGLSVMLAAGDTFRAAAVEQLQTWGERNEIHVVAQHSGADSASVIYDGVQAAKSRGVDVLIADTAGRLHTKSNLMEELSKIKRIMTKLDPEAPHEVLLVLDGGTGQNALSQAKQFNESVGLTGLAVTKLDGTAKGGVVFALAKQFGIPIRYIGVGETIDDLQDFDARKFIDALFTD